MSDTPIPFAPGDALLVAAPAEWREACLSVPALRALRRGGVAVTVLCPERQVAFWAATGFSDIVSHPDGAPARRIAGLVAGRPASLVWEAGAAADACAKAGLARRLGPDLKGVAKRLTERIDVAPPPGPIAHRVRFYLGIAASLGLDPLVPENFAPLELGVPRALERVLLVPDSDFGAHFEWPLDRWEAFARELLARGRQLVVAVGGPRGAALAGALPEASGWPLALPALEELAACSLCIAADGSVPHLAAHAGTTCVVLFGPGEPEWMRPLGKRHVIVRRKVECAPCHAPKCRMDLRCQHDLELAELLRGLDAVVPA
jgi:hypothetical protein